MQYIYVLPFSQLRCDKLSLMQHELDNIDLLLDMANFKYTISRKHSLEGISINFHLYNSPEELHTCNEARNKHFSCIQLI